MKTYNLYLYALDPTHIGAGGYRLGRVDNTILRDAASGLPKIPGSALSGACRSAAIYNLQGEERKQAEEYARQTLEKNGKPTGGAKDPVAKYFGFAEGHDEGESRIGALGFYDANILLFPVYTLQGPVWITTRQRLLEAGEENVPNPQDLDKVYMSTKHNQINFGWMLFSAQQADISLPQELAQSEFGKILNGNLAVVHEAIFASLVNANLEVRTSVAIDFQTGAASQGALFTYEAMPRGTVYSGKICLDNDRYPELADSAGQLLENALGLACSLGLGGMTTRGFGRMQYELKEQNHG